MHDKLGCPSAGASADRQVAFPHKEGAKSSLGYIRATTKEPRES
jgi:hypothetical protein